MVLFEVGPQRARFHFVFALLHYSRLFKLVI